MKLSDLSPADLARIDTAVHEAGHAVAVILAGGRVVEARINDDDPETLGECVHDDVPDSRQREVAYSGPWCATRWRHGSRPALAHVIDGLRQNFSDWQEVMRDDEGLPREVENTLEHVWPAIVTIAKQLFVNGRVGNDAVLAALNMTGDSQHDRLVRASIRCRDWSQDARWSTPGSGAWDLESAN